MANRFGLDLYDGCAVCGVAALLYGVAQWSGPAAWVVAGVLLLALASVPSPRKVKR